MNGDGFTALVQEGQKVKADETLLTFDRTKIAAAQHPDVVVVLVTNSDDYENLTIQPGKCKVLDKVIEVK
jgi:PTS system sucrose-specific IIC component